MSATSTRLPSAPTDHRDIRAASRPFKRDKDHGEKWANGQRPLHGIRINYNTLSLDEELIGGDEISRQKVRPMKQWTSEHKNHANKAAKPFGSVDMYTHGKAANRLTHKNDAMVDANDAANSNMSRSLLELVPQHTNNANSAIHTAIRESADGEILYSFDNRGPSPGSKGRNVDLGGLVEEAEKKWVSDQTDRLVKGEYEVLDNEGEKTVLKSKKKGSPKHSPKQKAAVVAQKVDEDDDYELV